MLKRKDHLKNVTEEGGEKRKKEKKKNRPVLNERRSPARQSLSYEE